MNLETRIREHYTKELNPTVFELLDVWKLMESRREAMMTQVEIDRTAYLNIQEENARLQKIKAGDTAEFKRMDKALDELNAENARLRAGYHEACQAAYDEIAPDCGEAMAKAAYHAVKTVLRKALENPNA